MPTRATPVVLEITPPREPRPEVLSRRAALLGPRRNVVNVIARSDRWASLEASCWLRAQGFDPVWHLTTRGRDVREIEHELGIASRAGLRRLLCVRGEYAADDSPETPTIREVVALARQRIPECRIGVTINHHLGGPRPLDNLLRKLEAGADFVQTQVTFDLRGLRPLARLIATESPNAEVYPMLLPVLTPRGLLAAARRLALPLDQALLRALEREGEEAGWRSFERRLGEILTDPHLTGAALMTPIDPNPGFAHRLRSIVDELAPDGGQEKQPPHDPGRETTGAPRDPLEVA